MVPARIDGDCAASERALFQRLADALPDHWTVFHSRTIVLPATKTEPSTTCEIDFLIVDPARGLLALEVKGGEVRRDSDDLWYSIDRDGQVHQIHNPQKQVTASAYRLREWLKSQPVLANVWLSISWGVVFTDTMVKGALGPELPRDFILDKHDLGDVAASIERLFEVQRQPVPHNATLLSRAHVNHLVDLLAPTIRLVPSLSDKMADADRELVRLTSEQFAIFNFCGHLPRLKVRGTAGSGKTLVAMERARREAAQGKRVLFLCFNNLLAQWLRAGSEATGVRVSKPAPQSASSAPRQAEPANPPHHPEPANPLRHPEPANPPRHPEPAKRGEGSQDAKSAATTRATQDSALRTQDSVSDDVTPREHTITLLTFHDLAKKLAQAAKIRFDVPGEAKAKQAFWEEAAPDLLEEALDKLPDHRWDSIVVDEAQDFRELWWLAIEKAGEAPRSAGVPRPRPEQDGTPDSTQSSVLSPQSLSLPRNSEEPRGTRGTQSTLWTFYDPHQDIFATNAMHTLIAQEAQLATNCRNTARIAEHAFAEIGERPTLRPDTPEGAAVETIQCANDAEMKDAVRRTLHRLVNEEKLDPSRIAVLTARNADKSILRGETLANLKLVDWPATNKNEIGYCSLQRFKGLEADVVVLCEVDRTKNNGTNKHLYVAQSRARQMLVVGEYA